MRYASLLLLAGAAFADDQADAAVVPVIRDYYATLSGPTPSIESVRDRLVPLMKQLGPKTGPSVRNVIRRGFDKKYKKELPYLRCLCEILAAGGDPGINLLYKQYEGSKKDDALRAAMAEVLGACGDEEALDPLLKMAFDKTPEVAATAVAACGKYAKVAEDKRKAAVKKLVELYGKVTDDAAGKAPDSTQMKMYEALRPAMNGTLRAFTGEALDSAAAFKAWFQENGTKPWSE